MTTMSVPCSTKRHSSSFAFGLMVILLGVGVSKAQLSPNFYASTCPNLNAIIRLAVAAAVRRNPRMGASLLRLHYVDCFVNGCDASILLDDNATFTGEKTAIPNVNSLRGFNVIDNIKERVERACPGVVSCADILTVAARDSVYLLGGPSWMVPLGRRDSTFASSALANTHIPGPYLNLDDLITSFARLGLTVRDMVALSGAHTIGWARCATFRDRLYDETNINSTYAFHLRVNCHRTRGDNHLSPLDVDTPTVFNNDYSRNLVTLRGLLHSDQQLFGNDGSTDALVRVYSINNDIFFNDFATAVVKMSAINPLTGSDGQIRKNCRRVN